MVDDHGDQVQRYKHYETDEYLLLCTSQLMILVPQSTVGSVHHLNDYEIGQIHASDCVLQCNSIRSNKSTWFAALSDELTLLSTIPKKNFLITTFTDYPDIHWCWRDLYQISGRNCIWFELPKIICTSETPVHALAIFGEYKKQYAFLTSAHDLMRFIFWKN